MKDAEKCAEVGHDRGSSKEFCNRCATKLPAQTYEEKLLERCQAVEAKIWLALRIGGCDQDGNSILVDALHILKG